MSVTTRRRNDITPSDSIADAVNKAFGRRGAGYKICHRTMRKVQRPVGVDIVRSDLYVTLFVDGEMLQEYPRFFTKQQIRAAVLRDLHRNGITCS